MYFPFLLIAFGTLLAAPRDRRKPTSLLLAFLVSLAWVLAFVLSGDRRLFFPFTLPLCYQLFAWRGIYSCLSLVALFFGVRFLQDASWQVLAVELAVTLPALGLPVYFYHRSESTTSHQLYYSALTSLLAFAGLAF